ncbi:MAG: phosphatidylglycerol lysyltransferase domain-containing protein [Bacteriovoracaceae bacterium]
MDNQQDLKRAQSEFDTFKKYGDRASSFHILSPNFKTFTSEKNEAIKYLDLKKSWVAANEPLAQDKTEIYIEFVEKAAKLNKETYIAPIGLDFSNDLIKSGNYRFQVGVELQFYLDEYFNRGIDPLEFFPFARALKKRGGVVREISTDTINQDLKDFINESIDEWLASKKSPPLGFLNKVEPWRLIEHKKLFVLEQKNEIKAFLFCTPIFPKNGFFFSDYIRKPEAKAGTIELLFIETMRMLKEQNYNFVTLGLCPFAQLDKQYVTNKKELIYFHLMNFCFEKLKYPLDFNSIYKFKNKFDPSNYEPIFVASNKPINLKTFLTLINIHLEDNLFETYVKSLIDKVKQEFKPSSFTLLSPEKGISFISKIKLTLSFALLFAILHAYKYLIPGGLDFFSKNGFTPGNITLQGTLIGPLFHNHAYHFTGDFSTFLLIGGTLEYLFGSFVFFLLTAFGLWLTNPISWLLVENLLKYFSLKQYENFLTETDYGSSNAIYAYAGAFAYSLKRPLWILLPFLANAIFLCVFNQSWLAIHHIVGLYGGYFLMNCFHLVKSFQK